MDYILHILVMVALFAILATSFNLLIGYAGLFALSHAAFFGIGAYATAIVATKLGLPFPLPLLVGLAVTAVAGVVIALPALRISGDYLVIVSLALQVIVIAVMLNWTGLTGGTDGIRAIPRIEIFGAKLDTAAKFLPLALIVAALCYWVSWRVGASPFGRALKAMRENEAAAQAVGKNIVAMKLAVFAIAAALASVAGSLYAQYVTFISADSVTLELTIYVLAMVILGGTGNLAGSLVGAALLGVLPESASAHHYLAPPERPQVDRPVAAAALEGRGLEKRFGGIVAVSKLDLELAPGHIT